MNEHLAITLKELVDAHAMGIPTYNKVLFASDNTEWSGRISDGGDWKLTKHSIESYTNNIRMRKST